MFQPIARLVRKTLSFSKKERSPSAAITQGLALSIENYLNEAIAYLVVRSHFGVTIKPITDFSPTVGKYSGAIALKKSICK
jgi:hypothetical protein